MDETTIDTDLRRAVEFHGHLCPGLAIGYRIARYVKKHHPRSEDEELVCIAENNSCSVDAISGSSRLYIREGQFSLQGSWKAGFHILFPRRQK
ncbi:MAG: FmdE family protein [Methanothrix sp.]